MLGWPYATLDGRGHLSLLINSPDSLWPDSDQVGEALRYRVAAVVAHVGVVVVVDVDVGDLLVIALTDIGRCAAR